MATHGSSLPGKYHGRMSPAGYSPWGRKESDTTEQLHFNGPGERNIQLKPVLSVHVGERKFLIPAHSSHPVLSKAGEEKKLMTTCSTTLPHY